MTMTPRQRRLTLTAHVVSSVGWLGAVGTSLVLGVVAMTGRDGQLVRAVYLTMDTIGWYALIPFSVASLLTGLVQSLGTTWGLFRHYWVVVKLLMNVVAIGILLLYTQTLGYLSATARQWDPGVGPDRLRDPSPVVHGAAALLLLLVAATLSVYKPRGVTGYGRRRKRDESARAAVRAPAQLR